MQAHTQTDATKLITLLRIICAAGNNIPNCAIDASHSFVVHACVSVLHADVWTKQSTCAFFQCVQTMYTWYWHGKQNQSRKS